MHRSHHLWHYSRKVTPIIIKMRNINLETTNLALKATGSVLLHRQCDGSTEQRKLGLSVRTSSPAWSARTSTTFLLSGRVLMGPGVAMGPLPSPILLQGKDVEGGVNRLVVGGSTGICITTAWVSATWLGLCQSLWRTGKLRLLGGLCLSFCSRRRWSQRMKANAKGAKKKFHWLNKK